VTYDARRTALCIEKEPVCIEKQNGPPFGLSELRRMMLFAAVHLFREIEGVVIEGPALGDYRFFLRCPWIAPGAVPGKNSDDLRARAFASVVENAKRRNVV
jgi:hypothetical protein